MLKMHKWPLITGSCMLWLFTVHLEYDFFVNRVVTAYNHHGKLLIIIILIIINYLDSHKERRC
jgi:hypothetical protein